MLKPFFFFLLLVSLSQGADLVEDTCKKIIVSNPKLSLDFCVRSLRSDPKSSTADLAGLGLISVQLSLKNATKTSGRVNELLKKPGLDPFDKMCLTDCKDLYSEAIDNLSNAVDGFKEKQYNDVNVWVSGAMEDADTCESGFGEKKGHVSPLTKENTDLTNLGSIVLYFTVTL